MGTTLSRWRTISGTAICNRRPDTLRLRRIGSRSLGRTKTGGPYRYGDTSVSSGGTKSGGFSCPNDHAVTISYRWLNIVSLAHLWWGSRVSSFEALNQHCWPQNERER